MKWLLQEALEHEPGERQAFLVKACGSNDDLRREIESLLAAHNQANSFLEKPVLEAPVYRSPHSGGRRSARTIPWWMYLVAASFAAMVLLIPYLTIWGPGDLDGVQATFESGAMRIRAIEAGSPPAEAGLVAGDLVVAVDDLPMRNPRDWAIVEANQDPVLPQRWDIRRGAERLELKIAPVRNTVARQWLAHGGIGYDGTAFTCFILGLLIAFRRPNDPVARLGSWFIMTASVAFGLPHNWAFVWRQLPAAVQLLLWVSLFMRFVVE